MKDILTQIRALPRWKQFAIVQGVLNELMIEESQTNIQADIPEDILSNVLNQSAAWKRGDLEVSTKEDFFKKLRG